MIEVIKRHKPKIYIYELDPKKKIEKIDHKRNFERRHGILRTELC